VADVLEDYKITWVLGDEEQGRWYLEIKTYVGFVMNPEDDAETFDDSMADALWLGGDEVCGVSYSRNQNLVTIFGNLGPIWVTDCMVDTERLYADLKKAIAMYGSLVCGSRKQNA